MKHFVLLFCFMPGLSTAQLLAQESFENYTVGAGYLKLKDWSFPFYPGRLPSVFVRGSRRGVVPTHGTQMLELHSQEFAGSRVDTYVPNYLPPPIRPIRLDCDIYIEPGPNGKMIISFGDISLDLHSMTVLNSNQPGMKISYGWNRITLQREGNIVTSWLNGTFVNSLLQSNTDYYLPLSIGTFQETNLVGIPVEQRASVFLDNVRIQSVPEPAVIVGLVLGSVLACRRPHREKARA